MYWRLLTADPAAARDIVLAEKPPISTETDRMDKGMLDQLLLHTGTLGSIYHKNPHVSRIWLLIQLGLTIFIFRHSSAQPSLNTFLNLQLSTRPPNDTSSHPMASRPSPVPSPLLYPPDLPLMCPRHLPRPRWPTQSQEQARCSLLNTGRRTMTHMVSLVTSNLDMEVLVATRRTFRDQEVRKRICYSRLGGS